MVLDVRPLPCLGETGGGAHVEEGMWREGGVTEEGDVGKVAERNGVTMEEA